MAKQEKQRVGRQAGMALQAEHAKVTHSRAIKAVKCMAPKTEGRARVDRVCKAGADVWLSMAT